MTITTTTTNDDDDDGEDDTNNNETNSKYDQALVKKVFAIYGLHQHNNRPLCRIFKRFQSFSLN